MKKALIMECMSYFEIQGLSILSLLGRGTERSSDEVRNS